MRDVNRNSEALGLHEHTCHTCGKNFECRTDYAYKKYTTRSRGTEYYCSYTCMRKAERNEESKKAAI